MGRTPAIGGLRPGTADRSGDAFVGNPCAPACFLDAGPGSGCEQAERDLVIGHEQHQVEGDGRALRRHLCRAAIELARGFLEQFLAQGRLVPLGEVTGLAGRQAF
jgi:hypothetical protein